LTSVLSLTLIRSSTAMYPAVAMPVWLQVGTKLNPLTYATDASRIITVSSTSSPFPLDEISLVLVFTALTGVVGSWLFSRVIEGGPAE
jgi:ABC-2 type transport system permease protein